MGSVATEGMQVEIAAKLEHITGVLEVMLAALNELVELTRSIEAKTSLGS